MARAVIGLDLSETSWKSVVVSRGLKEKIRIHGYATFPALPFLPRELMCRSEDPLPLDQSLSEFATQFSDSMTPLSHDASGFIIGIPEEVVTLRVLELPFTQASKIAQVLPLEAESSLAFDADDLLFDFFPLASAGGRTRVLCAAVKKDQVLTLLDRLKIMRIDPIIISPTALCFHHLLGLIAVGPETPDQRVAFVNVGEHQTELSVVEGKRTIFAMTLDAGMCPRPVAAEEGTEPETPGPPGADHLIPALLPVLKRAIHYLEGFAITANGAPPPLAKIILLGEGATLPGLTERLSEELGVETVHFRIPPEALEEAPEMSEDLHPRLGPALALALQKVLPDGRPGLNFRKGAFIFKPERQALIRKLIFPGVLAGVLVLCIGARALIFGSAQQNQAKAAQTEMAAAFKANFPGAPVVDPAAQLRQFLEDAKLKQTKYQDLSLPTALDVLSAVSTVIPPTISVTIRSFDYKGDRVTIYGNALKYDDPNQITKLLTQVPFFAKVDLENVTQVNKDTNPEVQFTIKIELRKGNP